MSRSALGPTQPPIQKVPRAPSPQVKRTGREGNHPSPLFRAEIKRKCNSISTRSTCRHGVSNDSFPSAFTSVKNRQDWIHSNSTRACCTMFLFVVYCSDRWLAIFRELASLLTCATYASANVVEILHFIKIIIRIKIIKP